jgi:hypothetical protein
MTCSVAAFDSFPFATIFLITAPRRQLIGIIQREDGGVFEFEECNCLSLSMHLMTAESRKFKGKQIVVAVHKRSPNRSRNSE